VKASEIQIGEEYGIKDYDGIQRHQIVEVRKVKRPYQATERTKAIDEKGAEWELAAVQGLWTDNPEWEEIRVAKAQSRELADALQAALGLRFRQSAGADQVILRLDNENAARLLKALEALREGVKP
jgi:hypothetical protein